MRRITYQKGYQAGHDAAMAKDRQKHDALKEAEARITEALKVPDASVRRDGSPAKHLKMASILRGEKGGG